MTERVVPLSWHVKRRSLSEETCKWGLYTVAVCIMLTRDEAGSTDSGWGNSLL